MTTPSTPCCELCKPNNGEYCNLHYNCPCHTPTTEKKRCKRDCGLCGICNPNVHGSAGEGGTPKESWRESFIKELGYKYSGREVEWDKVDDHIMSFIQSAIDEAVAKRDEEVLAECERMIESCRTMKYEAGKCDPFSMVMVLSSLADFIRGDKKIK